MKHWRNSMRGCGIKDDFGRAEKNNDLAVHALEKEKQGILAEVRQLTGKFGRTRLIRPQK